MVGSEPNVAYQPFLKSPILDARFGTSAWYQLSRLQNRWSMLDDRRSDLAKFSTRSRESIALFSLP